MVVVERSRGQAFRGGDACNGDDGRAGRTDGAQRCGPTVDFVVTPPVSGSSVDRSRDTRGCTWRGLKNVGSGVAAIFRGSRWG